MVFEPGLKGSYDLCIRNSVDAHFPVHMEATGPFAQYLSFSEQDFVLAPLQVRCIKYHLSLPLSPPEYGNTMTQVWAKQSRDITGGFEVLTNIHHKLNILVPYPAKYVTFDLTANDVNENQPVEFIATATNYGQQDVLKANLRLDIYGADDYSKFVTALYTDTKPIKAMETVQFSSYLPTTGLVPGVYKADAVLFYDQNSTQKPQTFRIGALFVRIVDYTRKASSGKINAYEITVESRWNNRIPAVHAEAEFAGLNARAVTPTVALSPWEQARLSGYLDLGEVPAGEYEGTVTVHYSNLTNRQSAILTVTAAAEEERPAAPVEVKTRSYLSLTSILLVVIVLLVVIDLIYIYRRRKDNEEG